MIDVGGAALLGAAARNAAGVAAVADPAHYPTVVDELRELGPGQPGDCGPQLAAEAFSTVAAYHAEIAAYLNQIAGNIFPQPPRARPREGRRPALRREPAPAGGVLPRDDAPQRHARRRRPSSRASRPSFNNLLDLDAAYRIARDFTAPTVAIVKHTDPVGLASHDELVEAYRHALETDPVAVVRRDRRGQPRAGRRDRPRDRRELVRGGRRAGLQPGGARHPARQGRPRDAGRPARPDRGHARLRHREPRLQARRRRPAGRERSTISALDRGQLQVVTQRRPTLEELTDLLFAWRAVRHVRSNAIVLARNGATVGIGAGQASAARSRSRSRCAGPATGPSSRSWRRTPTSRSRTASSSPPTPASRRSSSRAARSATRWRSRSPTATTWRWSSPAAATSGTDRRAQPIADLDGRSCSRSRWSGSPRRRRSPSARFMGRGDRDEADRGRDRGDAPDDGRDRLRRHDRHRRGRARRGADAVHRRAGRAARGPTRDVRRSTSRSTRSRARTSSPHGQAGAITVLAASERGRAAARARTRTWRSCASARSRRARSTSAQRRRENLGRIAEALGRRRQRHHGRHPRPAAPRRADRRGPRRRRPDQADRRRRPVGGHLVRRLGHGRPRRHGHRRRARGRASRRPRCAASAARSRPASASAATRSASAARAMGHGDEDARLHAPRTSRRARTSCSRRPA